MNVLLIGSGAREHALAWKLSQSPHLDKLYIAPGNGGMEALGANLSISATDVAALVEAARACKAGLTVVGPEAALAAGVVDAFEEAGLPIFGPTRAAAAIESSKAFSEAFMLRQGIPCAQGVAFDSYREAESFIRRRGAPIVVKADGLAAGKGVTVAMTLDDALEALDGCLNAQVFGEAGSTVVIQEYMEGPEVSVFVITDGERLSPLAAACDYKRALDGDRGPNTGGMGAYTPPEFWTPELAQTILDSVMRPAVRGLAEEGRPYRGVLYGGLMLTKQGPRVYEFNARFGDPEAQVLLPLLETDLLETALAVASGDLRSAEVRWSGDACVGIMIASEGYPDDYKTGYPIAVLPAQDGRTLVFHAGTKREGEVLLTSGGRVLTIVGRAPALPEAQSIAYRAAAQVRFANAYYRKDIASRAISASRTHFV